MLNKKKQFSIFRKLLFVIRYSQRGFTIIEVIVGVAIIGMIAGLFLTNYRGGGIRTDLIGSAQKLASDTRLAQNFSLGTREFNGVAPQGGWGVHFDVSIPDSYIIFADNDGDYEYDIDGEKYSDANLSPNITIIDITVDGISVNDLDIVFSPPDPKTYINGADDKTARITLKESFNNTNKIIEVNFLGLIDVVN